MTSIMSGKYYEVNPPTITGGTSNSSVRVTFDGKLTVVTPVSGKWSFTPSAPITPDTNYTISADEASETIRVVQNTTPSAIPTVNIPEMDNIFPQLAPSDMICSAEFSNLVGDVAPSCDLMGTVTALAGELLLTIRDEAGEIIGTIKESAAKITASIKTAISDSFGGSGDFLNKMKGHIASAGEWISNAKTSITSTISDFTNWATDKINAATGAVAAVQIAILKEIDAAKAVVDGWATKFQTALTGIKDGIASGMAKLTEAMSKIRGQMTEVVGVMKEAIDGIAIATCDALTSVLAGTPSDAFANITASATSAATKSLAAAKDIFNTGVETISEVHEAMVNAVGTGDVLNNVKGVIGSQVAAIVGDEATMTSNTNNNRLEMENLEANPPVFA